MGNYYGYTPAKKRANEKYLAEKTDTILLRVPKGRKEVIKKAATEKGVSTNQFIVDAINYAIETNSNDA